MRQGSGDRGAGATRADGEIVASGSSDVGLAGAAAGAAAAPASTGRAGAGDPRAGRGRRAATAARSRRRRRVGVVRARDGAVARERGRRHDRLLADDAFLGRGERGLDRGRRVRAVLVDALRELEQQLLRVDARRPASRDGCRAARPSRGPSSRQLERERPLAQARELLESEDDPGPHRAVARLAGESAEPRVGGRRVRP